MKPWYFEFKYSVFQDGLAGNYPFNIVNIGLPLSNSIRFTYTPELQIEKIDFFYYKNYECYDIPIEIKNFTEEEMFQYSLIYEHTKLIELKVFLVIYKYIENIKADLNFKNSFSKSSAIITGND